jgi:HSP20 family protein
MTIAFKRPAFGNAFGLPLSAFQPAHRVFVNTANDQRYAPSTVHTEQASRTDGFAPCVNVAESDTAYTLYVELPGVAKEDVSITVSDERVLTINGEKKRPDATGVEYGRTERRFGVFERKFALPKYVNAEGIAATFEHGVLTLTLPKTQPSTTTVEIK